jgi:hypothetical protein
MNQSSVTKLLLVLSLCGVQSVFAGQTSRISDVPIQPDYSDYDRTAPIFELGQPFLKTGNIDPGFEIPTGSVWQPQFILFGDVRSSVQEYKNGGVRSTEWVNRLNLFGQLKLTGTERFLIGLRPLDQDGRFTGRQFNPDDKTTTEENDTVERFYFEGDFGEIFPGLDPTDTKKLDWGFAVGRQPLLVQEGMLVNDIVDGLGVVRNSITLPNVANLRVTGFYGWDEINRQDNQEDESSKMYAVFSEMDLSCCTVNVDLIYVDSDSGTDDGYFAGISSVQRIGHWNTSFRAMHSSAEDEASSKVDTGTLFFAEASITPAGTYDNIYINGFAGIDQFTSAARDSDAGGPLGRTGILYAAVGMGSYGSALSNQAGDVYGLSIGYQKFMSGHRKQLIFELGSRNDIKGADADSVAFGVRYQQAIGKHAIAIIDGFTSHDDSTGSGHGSRFEMRWKF